MSNNTANLFKPEKVAIVEFKILNSRLEVPEDFETNEVTGHRVDNSLLLSFNLEEKLVKANFTVNVVTESNGKNSAEAEGAFHLVFIYRIDNLEQLANHPPESDTILLQPVLGNALSSITYATARGILLAQLQGTALHKFVLPIIDPNKLLHNK
ncbi:MAG TPA: hypothetical protein DCQ29_00340 [Chitinophagaceae bacterium]|nr:hypothetical protein [Chitinophagaceae bacterium]